MRNMQPREKVWVHGIKRTMSGWVSLTLFLIKNDEN